MNFDFWRKFHIWKHQKYQPSFCDTHILREMKFGNLRKSILVILEALKIDFYKDSTFETGKYSTKIPTFFTKRKS